LSECSFFKKLNDNNLHCYVFSSRKRLHLSYMRKRFKISYLIVLCCFTFTATAGSSICSCDMDDMQQNPIDITSDDCHVDENRSSDEPANDCCPDMNLCSSSTLFVSNASLVAVQAIQQSVPFPTNGHLVHNINSPPTPPPKLIN